MSSGNKLMSTMSRLPMKNGFLDGIFVVWINPAAPEIGTGAMAPINPLSK